MPWSNYPKCKYCGRDGLEWHEAGDRWVLVDFKGKRHSCPALNARESRRFYAVSPAADSEFEDLTKVQPREYTRRTA